MLLSEWRARIEDGALTAYADLWADAPAQSARAKRVLDAYEALYGSAGDVRLFSVPGRTEISGNHTDHNGGVVLGASVDVDILAAVSARDDGVIHLQSEGHEPNFVDLSQNDRPAAGTSDALIAGICRARRERGLPVCGFDAYTTSDVPRGSGLSSSAAFEVLIASIEDALSGTSMGVIDTARAAQYAERDFYGKPCGLLDQLAVAHGGLIHMDLRDESDVRVEPVPFPLRDAGYALCVVNTGGSHAALTDEYAAIPAEMKAVASYFGRERLQGISADEIMANARALRTRFGDRAFLRAYHFACECVRVEEQTDALRRGDVPRFLSLVRASGDSSWRYLQNVVLPHSPREENLAVALAATEHLLCGKDGAWRVHGGGFSGTIQVHLRAEDAPAYRAAMDRIFGEGSARVLHIRPRGAVELSL